MSEYVIRVSRADGAGEPYYIRRDKSIIKSLNAVYPEDAYTLASCKAACTRLAAKNKRNIADEDACAEIDSRRGRASSSTRLYHEEVYEPYEVNVCK